MDCWTDTQESVLDLSEESETFCSEITLIFRCQFAPGLELAGLGEGNLMSFPETSIATGRPRMLFLLRVSRFRFWTYTGGTFAVGYAMGMTSLQSLLSPLFFLYFLYFLIPANLFVYGINDYCDSDTDLLNPKKYDKEYRIRKTDRGTLQFALVSVVLASLTLMAFQTIGQSLILLSFLILSYGYSAKPFRLKAIAFLDFSSNYLYIIPGIFGYYLASGQPPSLLLMLGGFFYIAAMQLFSAIPDIEYDRASGIRTTAVVLGKRSSLVLCLIFWIMFAYVVILASTYHPLSTLALIYPLYPAALLARAEVNIGRVYWHFPYINTILGIVTFIAISFSKSTA